MSNSTLPDDLNPELIKACAAFIGKLTGLTPPPVSDFPPEMHAAFRVFAAEAKRILLTNGIPQHWNPVYNTAPVQRACGELPDGYEIRICMERGAGWIDIDDPHGSAIEFNSDSEVFAWRIHQAIDEVRKHAVSKGE